MKFVRSASIVFALVLCGAAPAIAPRPELTVTISSVDRGAIAANHDLAVLVTIKNVSRRVIYVDPLDVSLLVRFRLVCIATGEQNDSIGAFTLDEFEPPHTGAPLQPGSSISIIRHEGSVGAGVYRITTRGSLILPSSRPIKLPESNSVDVTVLKGSATDHAFDSCGTLLPARSVR